MINRIDLDRYFRAARMIEDDLDEAYETCSRLVGPAIASALLIAELRKVYNDKPDQWPPPDGIAEKVGEFLENKNLLAD